MSDEYEAASGRDLQRGPACLSELKLCYEHCWVRNCLMGRFPVAKWFALLIRKLTTDVTGSEALRLSDQTTYSLRLAYRE
jgi:hypothetical protein